MQLRVKSITYEAAGINAYELIDAAGNELPPFTAGAHIDVHVPGNFLRQYSLCNDPSERHRYVIGVLKVEGGRGGSKSMHENVHAGDLITVSVPRNNFPLTEARRYLLLAGGVGITPIMAMTETLRARGADFDLLYSTRSPDRTAFRQRLAPLADAGRVTFCHSVGDATKRLDVVAALREYREGTHLFCCGPTGLMSAVKAAVTRWPQGSVHFEFFSAPTGPGASESGSPEASDGVFEVQLAKSGARFAVPPGKSIVEVLRANGVACETSCEAGLCGTCRTHYLEGEPDHQDFLLTEEERQEFVLICCARSKSATLVLDR